ncbi:MULTISPECIES: hypothetical protein [unclassified Rhizobium]|uniref:hypothetical protein n=1 Tax=unclassified Rhizobium TaxID=2613769 RepID=UPI001FD87575|nr:MULTISPECIES: hypothetical protein [unclassified Rhizobium]
MPRPHVICHMMSPLDGRLIVNDWAEATGHSVDELVKIYDDLHEKIGADAWLSGRATGEEFADAVDHPYKQPARPRDRSISPTRMPTSSLLSLIRTVGYAGTRTTLRGLTFSS